MLRSADEPRFESVEQAYARGRRDESRAGRDEDNGAPPPEPPPHPPDEGVSWRIVALGAAAVVVILLAVLVFLMVTTGGGRHPGPVQQTQDVNVTQRRPTPSPDPTPRSPTSPVTTEPVIAPSVPDVADLQVPAPVESVDETGGGAQEVTVEPGEPAGTAPAPQPSTQSTPQQAPAPAPQDVLPSPAPEPVPSATSSQRPTPIRDFLEGVLDPLTP